MEYNHLPPLVSTPSSASEINVLTSKHDIVSPPQKRGRRKTKQKANLSYQKMVNEDMVHEQFLSSYHQES